KLGVGRRAANPARRQAAEISPANRSSLRTTIGSPGAPSRASSERLTRPGAWKLAPRLLSRWAATCQLPSQRARLSRSTLRSRLSAKTARNSASNAGSSPAAAASVASRPFSCSAIHNSMQPIRLTMCFMERLLWYPWRMSRREKLVAVGSEPDGAQVAEPAEAAESAQDELLVEEVWEEEPAPRRSGRVVTTLAILAILGGTGCCGWAHQREILAGGTPQEWSGWIVSWAVPVLLVVSLWLLAMRNSRRGASRFAEAASAL